MTASKSKMRRFVLVRSEDVSGTSGSGVVCEGVEYSDGHCGLHWLSQLGVWSVYANIRIVEEVHGHEGRTKIEWLD